MLHNGIDRVAYFSRSGVLGIQAKARIYFEALILEIRGATK